MASGNTKFTAPLIKRKGASLTQVNEYVYDLGVFCKNLRSVVITDDSFETVLQDALTAGVGNVLAGIGANYVLDVNTTAAYVSFREKDSNHLASVGAYAGVLRTGLIVDANGIAMGYNRKSDGNWQTSIVLDGTTGNVTLLGTLTAGSVIAGSVTVGGVALSTISSEAANGDTAYSGLFTNVSNLLKGVLRPNTTGALATGTITWNSTTGVLTGGSGIAITAAGIIGASAGSPTFSIDATTGAAIFSGTLSAANGSFSGNVSTSGYVYAYGSYTSGGIPAAVIANGTTTGNGVYGVTNGSGWSGVRGEGTVAGDVGVTAVSSGTATTALAVQGNMTISVNSLVTNLNANYLQGNLASAFAAASHTQAFSTITGRNTSLLAVDSDIPLGTFKLTKTRVNGHTVTVYDPTTHAAIATYEYSFA